MTIIILAPATVLIAAWLLLLGRVLDVDRNFAAHSQLLDKLETIKKLKEKEKQIHEKLELYGETIFILLRRTVLRDKTKEIQKLEQDVLDFQEGKVRSVNIFIKSTKKLAIIEKYNLSI